MSAIDYLRRDDLRIGDDGGRRWLLTLLDGWRLTTTEGVTTAVATRERRLVTLLALRGRQPRANIAATLWPDSDESRAQGNLRAAIWHLHHVHDGVVDEADGVLSLSSGVQVDVHQLRAWVNRLRCGGDVSPDSAVLELACYEDLLPGWTDPWVEEERALLHQHRLAALDRLAEALTDCGQTEIALVVAMRAVAIDPLRESAQRALVRVHVCEGNHVEALRVYEAFARRLRDELGVTVSSRMTQLVRELRAEPHARTRPGSWPVRLASPTSAY